ncbi:hypothetical protein [Spirillospora sp. CA-128828]|uniref:hypothetical protein n=1 Tax=Spirillospora sp. CA-128828 TaxID=3240033 RepID=UPI003D92C17A
MTATRLEELLEAGFTDGLSDHDKALLAERALAGGAGDEPFGLSLDWWYAVPGDQDGGVFAALNLHDPLPVTFSEGTGVEDLPFHQGAVPLFITPALDRWRLIFGNLDSVIGVDWDEWMRAVKGLSAHCGQAQMFFTDTAGGTDTWVVAEDGQIRRRFSLGSDPEWTGTPLPWERLRVDADGFDPVHDEADPNEGTSTCREACGHLSVDPARLSPDIHVRGHGWLALSEPGVGHRDLRMVVEC